MNKRRVFLRSGGALAMAACVPGGLSAASAALTDVREARFPPRLSKDAFDVLVGQAFFIHSDGGGVAARLSEVKGYDRTANHEQFTAIFTGEGLQALPARSYVLEHDTAGLIPLYLEPSSAAGSAFAYRADFSILS